VWGNSEFAEPSSSYNQTVQPVQSDPTDDPLVYIPINKNYIPYLVGAAQQLLLQAAYPDTLTDDELNLVQARWMTAISIIGTALGAATEAPGIGCGEGDCMACCLRFQNGVLQCYSCGVWTAVPGQPATGLIQPGQPGAGTPQPAPGGGCQTYNATMNGNSQWLLPCQVNTGDTITLTQYSGACNPPSESTWYCPTGGQFVAGVDVGGEHTVSTDPLNTAPHMSLIVQLGSSWYEMVGGAVTVPAGVVNARPVIQLNINSLSGIFGQETFEVQVCNNQTGQTVLDLSFSNGPQGWILGTDGHGQPWGIWNGAAFAGNLAQHYNGDSTYYNQVNIQFTFSRAVTLLAVEVDTQFVKGSDASGAACQVQFYTGAGAPNLLINESSHPTGSYASLWSGSHAATVVNAVALSADGASSGITPGSALITRVKMTIQGIYP